MILPAFLTENDQIRILHLAIAVAGANIIMISGLLVSTLLVGIDFIPFNSIFTGIAMYVAVALVLHTIADVLIRDIISTSKAASTIYEVEE